VLAGQISNRAFAAAIARAPVADAAAGAAVAPSGPLAQLRDELDDTFVDEDACLRYIGQLGPGERALVARDDTMLREMADAFNIDEMFQAVEGLDLPPKRQIHWLKQAGDIDDVGRTRMARLLNAATVDEFGELIGWEDVRALAEAGYDGDPLTLAPCQSDPVRVRQWLGTAGFGAWTLHRTGAPNLLLWISNNDPAASIAALKAGGKWDELLAGLRTGDVPGVSREPLKRVFLAATDAGDRRTLYEIRFARRAEGPFDWIADGEAEWNRQESFAGSGQTRAQVEAAIAGGGPRTAADAAAAAKGGPLEQLRDELDDVFVDEDKCLRLLGQLTDRELYLAGSDATMRSQMASAFNGREMTRALDLLRFLTLKEAITFIRQADEEGGVPPATYQNLVDRATSQDIAETIGWEDGCDVLRERAHLDPVRGFPALLADQPKLTHVVQTYGHYTKWAVRGDGGAPAYVRLIAERTPPSLWTAIATAGVVDDVLDALPTGNALAPPDRIALKTIHDPLTDLWQKMKIFRKRFDIDSMSDDPSNPSGMTFDAAALNQMWVLLERLPPEDVAGNRWLEALNRRSDTTAPTPEGITGSHRVAIGYTAGTLGALETGAFTDPADKMRGTNMFDSNLIHEMGHASDFQYHWTRDDGPFDTEADLGQWQNHGTDTDELIDQWVRDLRLIMTFPLLNEFAAVTTALKRALSTSITVMAAFQAEAAAGGGPAWGSAGDTWQPLYTRLAGSTIEQAVNMSQASNSPWMTPPPTISGRIYHDTGYNYWASYLSATRAGGKLSRYQFRDKRDFFAETYATYYLTPADPGSLVRAWNPHVADWFRENVDRGYSTTATP
jgi:hypothetical protein